MNLVILGTPPARIEASEKMMVVIGEAVGVSDLTGFTLFPTKSGWQMSTRRNDEAGWEVRKSFPDDQAQEILAMLDKFAVGDAVKPKPEWVGNPNNVPSGRVKEVAPFGKDGALYVGDEPRAFAGYVFDRDRSFEVALEDAEKAVRALTEAVEGLL